MKKHFYSFSIILFSVVSSFSQTPDYLWGRVNSSSFWDAPFGTATDASGNVFVCGEFWGDSIAFGNQILYNTYPNSRDIFLVKYDPSGNVLWAISAGGVEQDAALACATDASGNVYMTGFYHNYDITFGNITLTNDYNYDMFIVKFDPNGTALWAKSGNGYHEDIGMGITVDVNNNVIVSGHFRSNFVVFENDTLYNLGTNLGTGDIFIVKYDSSGNQQWVKSAGSAYYDGAYSCAADPNGNIFLTGTVEGDTAWFDNLAIPNPNSLAGTFFMAKYDAGGNAIWAQLAVGATSWAGWDQGLYCAADKFGNVFQVGHVPSSVTFGNHTLTQGPFMVKYDAAGNVIWATSGIGGADDRAYGCAVDTYGDLYVTGAFVSNPILFGNDTLAVTPGWFNSDLFVTKIDSSGAFKWAKGLGLHNMDRGITCTADLFGNVYVAGVLSTDTTMSFMLGSDSISTPATALPSQDVLVFKIECTPPSQPPSTTPPSSLNICYNTSTVLTVDAKGVAGWYDASTGGNYLGGGSSFNTSVLTDTTTFYVQDSLFCESSRTAITVNVMPQINVSVINNSNILSSSITANSYQWITCPGNAPINGAINSSYTPLANGDYAVIVTINNCADTSACESVTNVGIENIANDPSFNMYPNPANEQLTIENAGLMINKISIIDVLGRTATTEILNAQTNFNLNRVVLNIKFLTPGVYSVQVSDWSGSVFAEKKLVIVR